MAGSRFNSTGVNSVKSDLETRGNTISTMVRDDLSSALSSLSSAWVSGSGSVFVSNSRDLASSIGASLGTCSTQIEKCITDSITAAADIESLLM